MSHLIASNKLYQPGELKSKEHLNLIHLVTGYRNKLSLSNTLVSKPLIDHGQPWSFHGAPWSTTMSTMVWQW